MDDLFPGVDENGVVDTVIPPFVGGLWGLLSADLIPSWLQMTIICALSNSMWCFNSIMGMERLVWPMVIQISRFRWFESLVCGEMSVWVCLCWSSTMKSCMVGWCSGWQIFIGFGWVQPCTDRTESLAYIVHTPTIDITQSQSNSNSFIYSFTNTRCTCGLNYTTPHQCDVMLLPTLMILVHNWRFPLHTTECNWWD